MADLDKVLKGLECCKNGFVCGDDCPYRNVCFNGEEYAFTRIASDALELLKSQQAEIERLKKKNKQQQNRIKRMSADKEYWHDMWLATLEENDD